MNDGVPLLLLRERQRLLPCHEERVLFLGVFLCVLDTANKTKHSLLNHRQQNTDNRNGIPKLVLCRCSTSASNIVAGFSPMPGMFLTAHNPSFGWRLGAHPKRIVGSCS